MMLIETNTQFGYVITGIKHAYVDPNWAGEARGQIERAYKVA